MARASTSMPAGSTSAPGVVQRDPLQLSQPSGGADRSLKRTHSAGAGWLPLHASADATRGLSTVRVTCAWRRMHAAHAHRSTGCICRLLEAVMSRVRALQQAASVRRARSTASRSCFALRTKSDRCLYSRDLCQVLSQHRKGLSLSGQSRSLAYCIVLWLAPKRFSSATSSDSAARRRQSM